MAISTLFKLDQVLLPGSVAVSNIKSQRWASGVSDFLENPSGHVYPMFTSVQQQEPMVEFTSPSIDKILGVVGVGGAALGATTTYLKLATTTGSVARATTSHSKIVLTSSIAYWRSIRLSHNGTGEIAVSLMANYDGTNDPFIYTASVALNGNLAADNWFGAGPVSINGVAVPGIKEISIDNEVKLIQEGASSEEFDTFIGIESCRPTITIKTKQMVNWATLGLRGSALDGTNGIVCYGRKFTPNGSRVADATAGHLKFIGLLGTVKPVDTSGDGTSPMTDTLKATLVSSSDSVAPLTFSTASAIT